MDHQTVAPLDHAQPVRLQRSVQGTPTVRIAQLVDALGLNPAEQALHTGVRLHIASAVLRSVFLRHVVVRLQAKLALQSGAYAPKSFVVVVGSVDGAALGMDLVDRHMHVKVVGVVMYGADSLVLAVTQCVSNASLNFLQHVS
ncbi:hypothetical protein LMG7143_04463 [Ralstonia thomasii]|nr:hypothetical protein LMG7143_04463 [Ralstonia sp. LMG 18095]